MDKVMSWAEIEAAFDSEWVLIEDPEMTGVQEVVRGNVIFHGSEKEDLYCKLEELQPACSAIRFVGRLPEGWEMML